MKDQFERMIPYCSLRSEIREKYFSDENEVQVGVRGRKKHGRDKAVHELRGNGLAKALLGARVVISYICVLIDREPSLNLILVKSTRTASILDGKRSIE